MKYDIYHDESKQEAYWHCFLFVPNSSKDHVIEKVKLVRDKLKQKDISFKNLCSSSDTTINGCRSILSIMCSAFQQNNKNKLEPFWVYSNTCYNGKTKELKNGDCGCFLSSPQFKIAIFHEKNNHKDMSGNKLNSIETTFRMGLQGAMHLLFDDNNKITIGNIYVDGFEHYGIEHGTILDTKKIAKKLKENAKQFVNFSDEIDILDGNNEAINKLFLEIVDLFLGAIRLHYLVEHGEKYKTDKRYCLWEQIALLFKRLDRGSGIKNSRFYKFGSFSSCWIEDGERKFETIHSQLKNKKKQKLRREQISLFS